MKSNKSNQPPVPKRPTVIFTGGGTSGHINPALAIAKELKEQRPDIEIVFTGTKRGLEADIVPREGYEFISITASPFKRKISLALFKAFLDLRKGRHECLELIREREPIAVVGTGGYVAGPLLAAAAKSGVPYLIHEQNAFPGQSNRVMAPKSSAVCLSYDEARPYFTAAKSVHLTGNPIAPQYFELNRADARSKLNMPDDQFFVLVSGGSLGARSLNQTVVNYLKDQMNEFQGKVLLVAGKSQFEEIRQLAAGISRDRLEIVDYLYDMPYYMAAADLYICRAGAGTCAEVAALGQTSIMVPYPHATGDHQSHNAKAFSEIGGAVLCPNDEFTVEYLADKLVELSDPRRRTEIGEKAKSLAKPWAARDIVRVLLNIIKA